MLRANEIRQLAELEEIRAELLEESEELELREILRSSERTLRVSLERARAGIRSHSRVTREELS